MDFHLLFSGLCLSFLDGGFYVKALRPSQLRCSLAEENRVRKVVRGKLNSGVSGSGYISPNLYHKMPLSILGRTHGAARGRFWKANACKRMREGL